MADKTESVKVGSKEYRELRDLAKKRGQFAIFLLNQAIREFVQKQKE